MLYSKRVKFFVIVTALFMLLPVLRLAQLQLISDSSYLRDIEQLQIGQRQQTRTIRGRILDRNKRIIASEEPLFKLYVTYDQFSCYTDERVQKALRLKASQRRTGSEKALADCNEVIEQGLQKVGFLLSRCRDFGASADEVMQAMETENDKIWTLRTLQAWRSDCSTSPLYLENQDNIGAIPGPNIIADFARCVPDPNERLLKINAQRVLEMYRFWPILELQTYEDIFNAQTIFVNVDGIDISAQAARTYPYHSVASQLIGWVGPATQESDTDLFKEDRLSRYLDGELCGREDGIEYICEPILRGRRGELIYDIDQKLIQRTEKVFGQDVQLTLDIELQKDIESFLLNYKHRPGCGPGMAAVVLDVVANEILVLASLPNYDQEAIRSDYAKLADPNDPNKPLLNRALRAHYPPGSVIKPLIAIAGLESGVITPEETINCPFAPAPPGWPNCWIYKQQNSCHDYMWPNNNARNAIKGSCNIYFSHLAERIPADVLQRWLFRFGYGRQIPLTQPLLTLYEPGFQLRTLRQAPGQIASRQPHNLDRIVSLFQTGPLTPGDRRLAGIGQGPIRVTPLQVANSMAALARKGQFLFPRLFVTASTSDPKPIDLGISTATMNLVWDGMDAVINEINGTAHSAFAGAYFKEQGIHVYGKTGSTERPDDAWFAGFVKDTSGHCIALALVVEGGQSGGHDAAPLGREMIQLCIDHKYLRPIANDLRHLPDPNARE